MSRLGLLLALGIALPFIAQSCDIGDFTIDDVSDTVTVTNASAKHPALVIVTSGKDSGQLVLGAGKTETFSTFAATKYAVEVASIGGAEAAGYEQSLIDLRDELVDLSINPGDSAATLDAVLEQLVLVTRALHQLETNGLQRCGHAIVTGGANHATVTWSSAGGIGDLWVLSCE